MNATRHSLNTATVKSDDVRIDRLKEQLRFTPQELDFERVRPWLGSVLPWSDRAISEQYLAAVRLNAVSSTAQISLPPFCWRSIICST